MKTLGRPLVAALLVAWATAACDGPPPLAPDSAADAPAATGGEAAARFDGPGPLADTSFQRVADSHRHSGAAEGEPRGLGALARFEGRPPVSPSLALAVIGPEGGSLALGGFEIDVPPGAVARRTLFMVRRPMSWSLRRFVVMELYPHNVTFAVPVTVRMPLSGTTVGDDPDAAPVRWDWGEGGWARFPGERIEGGARIQTRVHRFSIWGLSRYGFMPPGELSSGG